MNWTKEKINLLRQEYPEGDLDQLAKTVDTTKNAVKTMAIRLKIRRKKSKSTWTEEEIDYLRKNYPYVPNYELAERMGRPYSSMVRMAFDLNLHKAKGYKLTGPRSPRATEDSIRKPSKYKA